jgi:hypothetical protein
MSEYQFPALYLAEEIGATYHGMMIAIPPPEWQCFWLTDKTSLGYLLCCLLRRK